MSDCPMTNLSSGKAKEQPEPPQLVVLNSSPGKEEDTVDFTGSGNNSVPKNPNLLSASVAPFPCTTGSPVTTGGVLRASSPVATSPNEKFILQYMGAAMMDSRCTYTPQMMPWIVAEILRFSEPIQVNCKVRRCTFYSII